MVRQKFGGMSSRTKLVKCLSEKLGTRILLENPKYIKKVMISLWMALMKSLCNLMKIDGNT